MAISIRESAAKLKTYAHGPLLGLQQARRRVRLKQRFHNRDAATNFVMSRKGKEPTRVNWDCYFPIPTQVN
jgi:hypothetical protein